MKICSAQNKIASPRLCVQLNLEIHRQYLT